MIDEAFAATAVRHADIPAVIDGGTSLTYGELAGRRIALARHLTDSLGIRCGSRVAVQLPNSWEFVVTFLALVRIGAVCVPLNPNWRTREVEWCVRSLGCSAAVIHGSLQTSWESSRSFLDRGVLLAEEIAGFGRADSAPPGLRKRLEEEDAVFLLTSGSTGIPKVAVRSHRRAFTSARAVADLLGIHPGERYLCVVPFHHANGIANCLIVSMICGCTAVVMPGFVPAQLAATARREAVRIMNGSPFIYNMLVESGRSARDFKTVEICLSSGEALPRGMAARCALELGLKIRPLYGSSETGAITIGSPADEVEDGCVGRPLPGIEVRIAGPDRKALGTNLEGEILVRCPSMMQGYLLDSEDTGDRFVDGWFCTGDLGRIDDLGNLYICGRLKQVINLGGIKIDPVEIENVLRSLPGVRDCCVRSVRGGHVAETVQAVIVLQQGRSLARKTIVEHCRRHLAEYKIPRSILFADQIPRDLMGKVPASFRIQEKQ